jgi:RNA polymerase sigma-70 factor (ECF subfamily)
VAVILAPISVGQGRLWCGNEYRGVRWTRELTACWWNRPCGATAEDAAQQALAKAAVNLPRLRKAEQFGRWAAAICRNEAKDLVRRRRQILTELPPEQSVSAPDESGEAVKQALSRLPDEAREVIYLRFYDGLSYEQISAVLGISGQAINGRLRRAKKQLAQYLRQHGFDEVDL